MKRNSLVFIPSIILGLIIFLLLTNNIYLIDTSFYKLVIHHKILTSILKFITDFGSYKYIVIISLILLVIYKERKKLFNLYFITCLSTILNIILKNIFRRPRPSLEHLVVEHSYSFPSGHAMAAMTFYGYLILMIYRSNLSKSKKIILILLLSTLIIIIGFSRIYLNVHYFSDVISGYLCSFIILSLFNKVKDSYS